MSADFHAVDVDGTLIIHSAEMQQYLFILPLIWDRELSVVPDRIDKIGVSDPRQAAFRGKRHIDKLIEAFGILPRFIFAAVILVKGAAPSAVESLPRITEKLRSGIFAAGDRGIILH